MKAISLWQPWASLWALDIKKYETRSWKPDHRGELAIHATKRIEVDFCYLLFENPEIRRQLHEYQIYSPDDFPCGAILATTNLVACYRTEIIRSQISDVERLLGDFGSNRFAWEKADTKLFERPIPWRGFQQLWEWNP